MERRYLRTKVILYLVHASVQHGFADTHPRETKITFANEASKDDFLQGLLLLLLVAGRRR